MTVYWLPSTEDDYLRSLRNLAYNNRVEIYSIGTRVQLAQPAHGCAGEAARRPEEVGRCGDRARRLPHPGLRRPEAGRARPRAGGRLRSRDDQARAEIAGTRGIMLGVEDDGGITSSRRRRSRSSGAPPPWAGMNLDIGNFRPARSTTRSRSRFHTRWAPTSRPPLRQDDGSARAFRLGPRVQDVRGPRYQRLHGTRDGSCRRCPDRRAYGSSVG